MFKFYSLTKKIVYDHFEGRHNYSAITECADASLGIFLNRRMAVQVWQQLITRMIISLCRQ